MSDPATVSALLRAGPRVDQWDEDGPRTCADRSEYGVYLTGRSITLGADDLAKMLADKDIEGDFFALLQKRGATMEDAVKACPKAGEILGEGDFAEDDGEHCGTCGGPVIAFEWGPDV